MIRARHPPGPDRLLSVAEQQVGSTRSHEQQKYRLAQHLERDGHHGPRPGRRQLVDSAAAKARGSLNARQADQRGRHRGG